MNYKAERLYADTDRLLKNCCWFVVVVAVVGTISACAQPAPTHPYTFIHPATIQSFFDEYGLNQDCHGPRSHRSCTGVSGMLLYAQ